MGLDVCGVFVAHYAPGLGVNITVWSRSVIWWRLERVKKCEHPATNLSKLQSGQTVVFTSYLQQLCTLKLFSVKS